METRHVTALRPHPENAKIYGDHADAELVESVKTKGVLTPLLITQAGVIISGHRRWDAAKKARLADVPVVLFGSGDDLDILEALIETNRYRGKNGEQLGREGLALLWVESERAKVRQQQSADETNALRWGSVPVHVPEPTNKGDARDAVGAKLGVSGSHAERASKVVKAIDHLKASGKEREAQQLRDTLNGKSVRAAFETAKERGYIAPTATASKPTVSVPDHVTLAQWQQMDEAGQGAVLLSPRSKTTKFNEQKDDSIEWALWSWNPVTGCKHDCSYCYARDIAERFYPWKFVPAFLPQRLSAPRNTAVPAQAATNIGYKNVFTCSMADLFGRWVPREWIEAVLTEVAANPQWNFLFLTKFPIRLAEFEFPDNAWVGTTVDAQARVKNAEAAFRNVRAGVKWLSCEPMLERLTFTDLSIFDWVVIGGASRSTETPEFRPPREWTEHLEVQARQAGCRVYEKTNLLERRREYPGQDETAPIDVPAEFKMRYLQRDVLTPREYEVETQPV